ncbi:MAG: hypothetical protein U0166_16175 [Acidobacteriota bacterium]
MKKLLAATALMLIGARTTLAVDLINKDDKKYEVKIHSGASTTNTSIEGNTTQVSVCSECKIEVVDIGTVEAKGSDKVVIKDGKVAKE